MTKLTTHVLDIYSGKPGKGILVELFYLNDSEKKKITSIKLNDDGRASSPLAEGDIFVKGKYELVFYIGEYFKNINLHNKSKGVYYLEITTPNGIINKKLILQ